MIFQKLICKISIIFAVKYNTILSSIFNHIELITWKMLGKGIVICHNYALFGKLMATFFKLNACLKAKVTVTSWIRPLVSKCFHSLNFFLKRKRCWLRLFYYFLLFSNDNILKLFYISLTTFISFSLYAFHSHRKWNICTIKVRNA